MGALGHLQLPPAASLEPADSMHSARSTFTSRSVMERGMSATSDATFYSTREGPLSR